MQALDLALVLHLYEEHQVSLAAVRQRMRRMYRRKGLTWQERSKAGRALLKLRATAGRILGRAERPRMLAQLDDISAELTYLLVRHTQPRVVVEISPCHGWSTCWLLAALRDNGRGELHSFDLIDAATKNVPAELAEGRWHFHKGDIRSNLGELPSPIDYLFMDSDHSAAFAHWYIELLFPLVAPGGGVSVDDVYHDTDLRQFDGEGEVIVEWLREAGIPFFCASSAGFKTEQNAIHALKASLGLASPVRACTKNPTVFFVLPETAAETAYLSSTIGQPPQVM